MASPLLLALFLGAMGAEPPAWVKETLRLTGESSAAREQAIETLKKLPEIDKQLEEGLKGSYRPLAVDAIGAMGLKKWVPKLLELAPSDETGNIYLCLNTLTDKNNREQILSHYQEQIEDDWDDLPVPSFAVILDTLGRTERAVSDKKIKKMMKSKNPDIRSAVYYYLRALIKNNKTGKRVEWLALLREGMEDSVEQIQTQVKEALKELSR